jgi:HK97 family phage portal protein
MFGFGRKQEARSVTATQSSPNVLQVFGWQDLAVSTGEVVTIESALGVPAIWAAVNFLAGTIAGLPLKVYTKSEEEGRTAANAALSAILHDVANTEDLTSSFEWRKWWMEQALTGGRGVTFIERNSAGRIINLWPLDAAHLTIKRVNGRRVYDFRDGARQIRYEASEVLDLPYMLGPDRVTHRSPIMANRETVGMAQAITKYAGQFFRNGGVPPFAVVGNFQSPGSMQRAAEDLDAAVKKASKEARQALVLPAGLDIKPIGADAAKTQMVEAQRFVVEQIARIYSMPPVFLQDLTHGTFSNTEQQDLHLVKHTIKRFVEQIEQEINLKFFGRGSKNYVEFSLDGLLRGDFKTRMDGYAQAIQNGILMPNEARQMENRQAAEGGDRLMIQGATVPLATQTPLNSQEASDEI